MYEAFYGLKEKPFSLSPDPQFLYMSRSHENACVHLRYALKESKGFVVITGDIGSGKTTLINFLLHTALEDARVAIVNHTSLSPVEFIRMMCEELEIESSGLDKAGMLMRFHDFLIKQFSLKKRVVLVVDEAQNLPLPTIEEIRMLSNLESEKAPLLQVLLTGQPELQVILQQPELRQFSQRVSVTCHLGPLGEEEVGAYIAHRLKVAGGSRLDLFDTGAIQKIYELSRGIPRLVNLLCDGALVSGFADNLPIIDQGLVEEAARLSKIGNEIKSGHGDGDDPRTRSPGSANFASDQGIRVIEKMLADLSRNVGATNLLMTEMLKEIREIKKAGTRKNGGSRSRPRFRYSPRKRRG